MEASAPTTDAVALLVRDRLHSQDQRIESVENELEQLPRRAEFVEFKNTVTTEIQAMRVTVRNAAGSIVVAAVASALLTNLP